MDKSFPIAPWQTPFNDQASRGSRRRDWSLEFPHYSSGAKIAPALAVGCTIVCKPASQTPLSLINVFDCLIEAGLPKGVANLVMGSASEISDEFMKNTICRKISFTGSTEVGKQLMRSSGSGKTTEPRIGWTLRRSLSSRMPILKSWPKQQ